MVGWLCRGFLEKTNLIVITLASVFVLYTRSTGVAYCVVGAVGCSLSVKLGKKIIRQPRPSYIPGRQREVSYGMPSTHSASIAYFATYILLSCIHLPIHPSFRPGFISRVLPPSLALPWAVMIVMSRVWLGHHTWRQVFAGVFYGVGWAALCFKIWTMGLNDLGKEAEQALNSNTLWQ
ncbi:hypothetical protein M413DRAFT_438297 [Hebeloma cylindrosporum]|uniref:Phosphatidic acid phosphatase type 2/haloperoxidase domain-containing protein n=1 Tax=Hebeloma cylindrosporum TaxID=76867 RepID=A0A0C2YHE3_HEBCY|nr:hypothetical protein M413DRAFT_438297 [Hebeloma cylindrosporum h7]